MGVRVEEQHQDGCVHWHALVWIDQARVADFTEKIEKYFGAAPLSKIVEIDPTRASAASYLMKYILKATGAQYDGTNADIADTATRSDAHRATWGGRAIQFFDIKGSATIWDEIRRIRVATPQFNQLSEQGRALHMAATGNQYADFLEVLQTVRGDDAISNCAIWYTRRGSGTRKINGMLIDLEAINTHSRAWKLCQAQPCPKTDPDASSPLDVRTVTHSYPSKAREGFQSHEMKGDRIVVGRIGGYEADTMHSRRPRSPRSTLEERTCFAQQSVVSTLLVKGQLTLEIS
ncbi:hypothetical protein GCM10022212_22920 [Actimicrobium antarcticum]|uniref:Helitron helicase-like domain-containing protein n=2 Tax=Actimicrobium antarcticum TaxID=1051899 RepID=A0ABP7TEE4_9BURK